ncbi:MAG: hypothetical protein E6Z55_07490, partial [Peptoniphilus harei]|nr:hypothetical protein [Peptoniphilus harei]
MKYEIKKKIIKPLCIYSLAFSMLLPSLTGVVEAASDMKVSNTEKLVASEKAKTEENKKEVREDKAEVKEVKKEVKETKSEVKEEKTKEELEDILTEDEIQEIRNRANNLENDYFFNGNMVEELKAELRKAKADSLINYQEAKSRLINEAILKNAPRQKAPGETRAITVFQIKDGDKLESGMTEITVKGRGWVKEQTIEVLVNNAVKGSYKWTKNPNKNYQTIKLSEALKENDKVKAILKSRDGSTILAQTQEYIAKKGQPKLAEQHKDKLKMPTGEIWIEQTSSNLVNDDEQAEAVEMLKDANTAIAGDIKLVKFSIDGTDHAYYEITYTDGSTSGKIEATDLKIKTITETSATPTIEKVKVTDGQIIVTLEKEVAPGTKFYFVKNFTDGEDKNFCENGSCKVVKSTSQDMSQAVSVDGTKVTFQISAADDLELGREFGIVVKEPHKFRSCAKSEPVVTIPDKVSVRDPHKLTDDDKKAIDKAIRDANTVNGKSKLPDSLEGMYYQAFIDFDKDGNARIINPNNVEGDWDWSSDDGIFVPKKNDDGTYIVKDESQVIKIPAKDLLKNIKPKAPTLALSEDKKSITITPNEKDTDANSISVSYTGKDGKTKTTTATKDENDTWSISEGEGSVDQNGVITLPKDKVKGGTDVTATVTDKGGIADDDTTPLTSEEGTLSIEMTKAEKVEALGGIDPVVMKKWVGDTVDWKDGVKASDSATEENKAKINELLEEVKTTFEDATRDTSAEGDFTGTIKVSFDDGSSVEVKNQKLYVSNHVTSMNRKDKVPTDAIEVEFKLGEGTKVDNTDGSSITGPNSYQKYKVKSNTNLKEYKIPVINTSVVDSIKVTPQEGYIEPVWRDSKNGTNFVATADNNVFTATATKTFKVTVKPNGGTGEEKVEIKKKDETYTLPAGNTFTPPENQEFAGWLVGDATTTTEPGKEITITGDTVIKASWKPIMVDVSFDKGEGSGSKDKATVAKGSEYTLPDSEGFTPPENKEFAGWEV